MAPSLDELLNSSLGGIIEGGGLGNEEAMYQRQAQAERESTFGRGLGISSVTRDALAKARVDASLAAQSAQLSALGQAAGITQGNANRSQQASQFGANLNQRNKELGAQESMANKQMLASGLGAGAGAALNIAGMAYRPQIQDFLGVKGRDAAGPNGTPGGVTPGPVGSISNEGFSLDANTSPLSANLGDLGNLGAGSGGGGFEMPDISGFGSGGFDLGGLFDFDPYQWGDYL